MEKLFKRSFKSLFSIHRKEKGDSSIAFVVLIAIAIVICTQFYSSINSASSKFATGTTIPNAVSLLLDNGYAVAASGQTFVGNVTGDVTGNVTGNVSATTVGATTLNAPTGRTASYVIATSDASALQKSQADDVLTGTNDYIKLQADINTAQASGGGVIKIIGANVILGATGVTFDPNIEYTTFDFSGTNIEYSGTGAALSMIQSGANLLNDHLSIIGGVITATGAAISSATASGILVRQEQYGYFSATIYNFQAGTAIKLMSGDVSGDFSENNHFNIAAVTCLTGIWFTGSNGTDYNTIDFLYYDNIGVSTGGTGILTNDTFGTHQLEIVKGNFWLHSNNTVGIDLTNSNDFHFNSITFEESSTGVSGVICVKTEDAISRGAIDNIMAVGGTGGGTAFSIYPATGNAIPATIQLTHYAINYMNPNFSGVNLAILGTDVNPNPYFTTDISTYNQSAGTTIWEAAQGSPSVGCLSHVNASVGSVDSIYGLYGLDLPVISGTTITLTAKVKTVTLASQISAGLTTYDSSKSFIANPQMNGFYTIQPADGWSMVSWTTVIPQGVSYAKYFITISKQDNSTKTYLDTVNFYVTQNAYTYSTLTSNHGTATGTGAQQAVNTGVVFTPNIYGGIVLWSIDNGANPYFSAGASGSTIYVTAVNGLNWGWYVLPPPNQVP